jgi:hypothetical protein
MRIKFFAGKWDSWGLEISYCHWYRGMTIGLLHWYFGFEIWTKEEVEIADKVRRQLATDEEEFFEE